MCGFAGEVAFTRAVDPAVAERMAATMSSRGPDGRGSWTAGRVAMAHRRLKVIDLTAAGDQPMVDDELGLTIAFIGCIYNHRDLRRELEHAGYTFFSGSDTEVILKAYDRWGARCVHRLIGMFAFALCEHRTGRTVLARDRLGIKPMTILRGVRKIAPATVVTVEPDGETASDTYWRADFSRQPAHADWTDVDWSREILAALRVAVQRRMVADVPVGVLLSGGLDSSLIVGLLAERGQSGLQTSQIRRS
ncbi:MAG TPA: asparagine synthase-related protein [Solirubrobacteraceae bacterium]|nr:asparagine synthase-related protein [Solirubrobacteraceae bacterium]